MDAQLNPDHEIQKAYSFNVTVASADFDRWAVAVRKQMLDCLQKRDEKSRHSVS